MLVTVSESSALIFSPNTLARFKAGERVEQCIAVERVKFAGADYPLDDTVVRQRLEQCRCLLRPGAGKGDEIPAVGQASRCRLAWHRSRLEGLFW